MGKANGWGWGRATCISCGGDKFYLEFGRTEGYINEPRCVVCGREWEAAGARSAVGCGDAELSKRDETVGEGGTADESGDVVSAPREATIVEGRVIGVGREAAALWLAANAKPWVK